VRSAKGELRDLGDWLGEINELRRIPGTLVWLDLEAPGPEEIRLLEREFSIHPLAAEDLRKQGQRPKLDSYPDQHVLVAYEAQASELEGHTVGLSEVHLFVGAGYVVSAHWGDSPALVATQARFRDRSAVMGSDVGHLLYSILDAIVDSYFPHLDRLSDEIDKLEDLVLAGPIEKEAVRLIIAHKRELLELRRVLAPMRDVANELLRRDIDLVEAAAVPYYQDLYDHLIRVLDAVDLYRDLVASVLDANLAVQSNSLNAVMKRLTAFTVILMVPTLIAGIYGMNFEFMPELTWPIGYFMTLAFMAVAVIALFSFFRARDWF
jgi:magnesium transporter